MANLTQKFPPKFSTDILYPAEYHLDQLPMPTGNVSDGYPPGDVSFGTYFNVEFPGLAGSNAMPTLSYGKHLFKVSVIPGAVDTGLPRLKLGSRIQFEFKDANDMVVFSDITPISSDLDFWGYVWIKQDPLRTYDSILEGLGSMTVVGVVESGNSNWRRKFNVRSQLPINISLITSDILEPNISPIIFKHHTGSMYNGLFVEEQVKYSEIYGIPQSTVYISASRMDTYSGDVSSINVQLKLSGSSGDGGIEWQNLGNRPLASSSYEDEIAPENAAGLNTLSETFNLPITANEVPINLLVDNKVKFKLRFKNPIGDSALYSYSAAEEYVIEYPSGSNDWVTWEGSQAIAGDFSGTSDPLVVESSVGQFSFFPDGHSIPQGTSKGQTFHSTGKIKSHGGQNRGDSHSTE